MARTDDDEDRPRKRKKKREPEPEPEPGLGSRLLKPVLGLVAGLVAFAACGLLATWAVTALFGPPKVVPPQAWQEHVLADRFKVSLPGPPTVGAMSALEGVPMQTLTVAPDKPGGDDKNTFYRAACSVDKLPAWCALVPAEKLLNGACDGARDMPLQGASRVKETSRTAISFDGQPGKEVVLEVKYGDDQPVQGPGGNDRAWVTPAPAGRVVVRVDVHTQREESGVPVARPISELRKPIEVTAFSFSHDGLRLATCGYHTAAGVSVWDARTGRKIATLRGDGGEEVSAFNLAFSPDGELLATAHLGVTVWDAKTFRKLGQLDAGKFGASLGTAFSPDSRSIVGVGFDGFAVWDLERDPNAETVVAALRDGGTLKKSRGLQFTPRGDIDFGGLRLGPTAFAFRPTDSRLAAACGSKILFLDLTKQPWWK